MLRVLGVKLRERQATRRCGDEPRQELRTKIMRVRLQLYRARFDLGVHRVVKFVPRLGIC